jgi:hypothetical protein
MTTGSVLYLLMCLAMFGVFAVVLAYQSWQQAKFGPEMLPDSGSGQVPPTEHADDHHALAA